MPYKSGSLKGKLNASEIRTLIKAHNVLNTIKIPKGANRDDLIKLVEGKGYSINHEKQSISRKIKKRTETISLEGAKAITKPKPLTEEQKKQRQQAKQKKAGEKAFLKKAIPAPPSVSKPSKGVKVGKPPPKPKPSKEDEVRPARQPAPPIPKAKDFVKIGGMPAGQRVDTSGSRNVANVVEAPKKKTVVKNKKPKPQPKKEEPNITQLKGFKVLEKVYQKGYAKRIKLRKKYLEGGFKNETDWEMADEDEDDEMRSEWMALSIPQDDIKFLFLKSPYNDKGTVLQKVDGMLEKRVENYKTWLNLMKKEPKN
jgi:hypothetical protein